MYLKVNRWSKWSFVLLSTPCSTSAHRSSQNNSVAFLRMCKCFCNKPYLQPNVTELPVFPQGVHFGHGRVQETFILKDQITVLNHLGKILTNYLKKKEKRKKYAFSPALMNIFCSVRHAFRYRIVNAGLFH